MSAEKINKQTLGKNSFLTTKQKRLAIYIIIALLPWFVVFITVWNLLVTVKNKENYELQVVQFIHAQKQRITDYQTSVLSDIRHHIEDDLTRNLLTANLSDDATILLRKHIRSAIQDVKTVRFYYPGQAQQEKDAGGSIGFVVLDMINRLERKQTVYPEASKVKSSSDWQIHWVAPIYKGKLKPSEEVAVEDRDLLAIVYVSTSTKHLQQQLMSNDAKDFGHLQVIQTIGNQKPSIFMSVGLANTRDVRFMDVADSHWQVTFSPSTRFISQIMSVPIWFIAFALISLAGVVLSAFACAQRKSKASNLPLDDNNEVPVESSGVSNKRNDMPDEKKDDKPQEALSDPVYNDPIYLVDEQYESEELVADQNREDDKLALNSDPLSEPLIVSDSMTPESFIVPHIFRAYDIRGVVGRDLNMTVVEAIGKAIASEALENGEKALIVGYDSRSHSPEIYEQLKKGILSTGCDIIKIGLVPTPLTNFGTVFSDQTGSGVMITASHNPKEYNGFKVVINQKTLADTEIQRLRERIEGSEFAVSSTPGRVVEQQFQEDYIDTITADIAVNADIRIVIDAANGAASQLAPALFEELGCQVTRLFCDFDGDFPNHDPDPTLEANLQALIQEVKANKADLGLALDGDGDRLVVVTSSGRIVWPDQLLMLFARDVVSRNPGCDVIFDVKSTRHLNSLISGYGGRPVMWKTGHAHIKSKMRETEALLAGEFSGHIFFKERWFGFDDGLYAAARLLEIISLRDQSLDDMLVSIPNTFHTPEIKIPVPEERKFELIEQLIASGDFASGEKTTIDGLRVDFDKGWGLVRASNTSPALTLRFEADNENGVNQLKVLFKRELQKIDAALDLQF